MTGEGSDSDCEGATKNNPPKDGWIDVPKVPWAPTVDAASLKEVRLRKRTIPESTRMVGNDDLASSKIQFGPVNRSHCTVRLENCGEEDETAGSASVFEFRLGELHGHRVSSSAPPSLLGKDQWSPPSKSSRIEVAPWVTVAVCSLVTEGSSAEFEAAGIDIAATSSTRGGLVGRVRVTLLQLVPTSDLLADDGIVLRILESGGGVKPRDLAHVTASWRAWFVRSNELIMSSAVEGGASGGTEFVLDEVDIMVPLALAFKEIEVGSRACLRVSEEWGNGPLLPSGSPVLRGAAIWIEIRLIAAINEPAPGEHNSVSDALSFALKKKEQGNASITLKGVADWGRAVRRYEAGIRTLEAVLPETRNTATGSGDKAATLGPVAEESDISAVCDCLSALRLNAAQGELKRHHWKEAIRFCDAVLRDDSRHAKARYRRGLARLELEQIDDAVEDFRAAIATNPADATLRKELARAETLRKEQRDSERKAFGGVFEKMIHEEEQIRKREEAEAKEKAEREAKEKAEATAKAKVDAEKRGKEFWNEVEVAKAAESERRKAEAEEEEAEQVRTKATELVEGSAGNLLGTLGSQDEVCNNYLMPPQNFETRKVETPAPISYKVPSFLKHGKPKASVAS